MRSSVGTCLRCGGVQLPSLALEEADFEEAELDEEQRTAGCPVPKGSACAFFFKSDRYLRYNIATDAVDVGPTEIARNWPRLPAEFQSDIDATLNWGNGRAYFKKARYLRYDIRKDRVDVGPTEISRYWPRLPVEFQSNISAAVNWSYPIDLAAFMRNAGLTVIEERNWRTKGVGSCFTPVGIMMHHTTGNGPNDLADVVRGTKANFYVDRAATIHMVAAGRANHAGKGARQVLDEVSRGIAPTDTAARRRLQDRIIGNGHFYGFENENLGNGQAWPADQLDTMARAAASLCQLHCWRESRVISHAEWTKRKVDPTGIDMNDFRRRVASFF